MYPARSTVCSELDTEPEAVAVAAPLRDQLAVLVVQMEEPLPCGPKGHTEDAAAVVAFALSGQAGYLNVSQASRGRQFSGLGGTCA